MTAANFRLDQDDDEEMSERAPHATPDDHLATTKMPAIARPPLPPARVPPSISPPAMVPAASTLSSPTIPPPPPHIGGSIPSMPPPLLPSVTEGAPPATESKPPTSDAPRAPASWWRALLTSTAPPSAGAMATAHVADGLRVRLAVAAALLGLVSFVAAVIVGSLSAPSEILMPSTVAASIVLSRTLMSIALFAVGLALLRSAERLLFSASPRPAGRP